jgi:DNA-binding MarR family transcriptional regulator
VVERVFGAVFDYESLEAVFTLILNTKIIYPVGEKRSTEGTSRMTNTWDAAGYVASSRYRLAVCEYLLDHGPGLPSEISSDTDLAQPHVSRALSELRDRGVVELLVPESQQKGRLYDLTEAGQVALNRLEHGRDAIEVEVVSRTEFRYHGLIDYLEATYPSVTQAIATYDGDAAYIHFFEDQPTDSRSSPIVRLWTAPSPNGELTSGATGRHEFTVYGLENLTLVDLSLDDEDRLGISLDDEADVPVRSFVDSVENHLSN